MDDTNQNNLNIAAKILMGIVLLSAIVQLLSYYQLSYLMIKPAFFPDDFIAKMKDTSLKSSIVCASAFVPALIFYFFKKPAVSLVIAMLALGYLYTRYSINEVFELQKTIFVKH